jgi:hypothetical protein
MSSTKSAGMPSTESAAETCMSHAGKSVVALHAGKAAVIVETPERAAISAWILAFKAPGAKTFSWRSGESATAPEVPGPAAEARGPATPESLCSSETTSHRAGIRHTQSVTGIVCPHVSAAESAVKITKTEAVKEVRVYEDTAAEPVRSPSPAETSP